jgi:hypothetical protein
MFKTNETFCNFQAVVVDALYCAWRIIISRVGASLSTVLAKQKSMRKQDKITFSVFLIIAIFIVLLALFRDKQLKSNGVIVFGKIIDHGYTSRSAVLDFKYSFLYKGKTYENWSSTRVNYSPVFIGKTFPVQYSPKLNIGEMLITPRDFAKYKLPFPDSLKWVLPYIIK